MTTIAWDGKTLAADKQATYGGSIARTVTKLHRTDDAIYGFAGSLGDCLRIVAWVSSGALPDAYPQFDEDEGGSVLMIRGGQIYLYGDGPHAMIFEDEHFAIGSGAQFALAAMAAGKTAKQAVEIASKLDPFTGMGVDVLKP